MSRAGRRDRGRYDRNVAAILAGAEGVVPVSNAGAMTQIPPAGPTLTFDAWTRIVVDTLRGSIPTVIATQSVPGMVNLRYRTTGAIATIAQRGDVFSITTQNAGGAAGMGELSITRHDAFTAANVAETLVGFFDPAKSRRR